MRGEERLPSATEAEIYRSLDLPWIPPEIREAQGEIEAAQAGTLPRLLESSDLLGELHLHVAPGDGPERWEAQLASPVPAQLQNRRVRGHRARPALGSPKLGPRTDGRPSGNPGRLGVHALQRGFAPGGGRFPRPPAEGPPPSPEACGVGTGPVWVGHLGIRSGGLPWGAAPLRVGRMGPPALGRPRGHPRPLLRGARRGRCPEVRRGGRSPDRFGGDPGTGPEPRTCGRNSPPRMDRPGAGAQREAVADREAGIGRHRSRGRRGTPSARDSGRSRPGEAGGAGVGGGTLLGPPVARRAERAAAPPTQGVRRAAREPRAAADAEAAGANRTRARWLGRSDPVRTRCEGAEARGGRAGRPRGADGPVRSSSCTRSRSRSTSRSSTPTGANAEETEELCIATGAGRVSAAPAANGRETPTSPSSQASSDPGERGTSLRDPSYCAGIDVVPGKTDGARGGAARGAASRRSWAEAGGGVAGDSAAVRVGRGAGASGVGEAGEEEVPGGTGFVAGVSGPDQHHEHGAEQQNKADSHEPGVELRRVADRGSRTDQEEQPSEGEDRHPDRGHREQVGRGGADTHAERSGSAASARTSPARIVRNDGSIGLLWYVTILLGFWRCSGLKSGAGGTVPSYSGRAAVRRWSDPTRTPLGRCFDLPGAPRRRRSSAAARTRRSRSPSRWWWWGSSWGPTRWPSRCSWASSCWGPPSRSSRPGSIRCRSGSTFPSSPRSPPSASSP